MLHPDRPEKKNNQSFNKSALSQHSWIRGSKPRGSLPRTRPPLGFFNTKGPRGPRRSDLWWNAPRSGTWHLHEVQWTDSGSQWIAVGPLTYFRPTVAKGCRRPHRITIMAEAGRPNLKAHAQSSKLHAPCSRKLCMGCSEQSG